MAIAQLGSTAGRVLAMGSGRWALIPALPLCCVALGKLLLLSGLQFPSL